MQQELPQNASGLDALDRLREAYLKARRFAEVASSLVRPVTGPWLVVPPHLTKGRKDFEEWNRDQILSILELDAEQDSTHLEGPSLDNAAGAWCLYNVTIVFEVARCLPGIFREVIDRAGGSYTHVAFDNVTHDRVRTLLNHLARTQSDRARPYLRLVARCYLLDMGPELAVMARAALEAYLTEIRGLDDTSHELLENMIDQCGVHHLLSEESLEAAHLIRKAGNNVAHGRPSGETSDAILHNLATAFAPPQP